MAAVTKNTAKCCIGISQKSNSTKVREKERKAVWTRSFAKSTTPITKVLKVWHRSSSLGGKPRRSSVLKLYGANNIEVISNLWHGFPDVCHPGREKVSNSPG